MEFINFKHQDLKFLKITIMIIIDSIIFLIIGDIIIKLDFIILHFISETLHFITLYLLLQIVVDRKIQVRIKVLFEDIDLIMVFPSLVKIIN
jgi:hypothetical protein